MNSAETHLQFRDGGYVRWIDRCNCVDGLLGRILFFYGFCIAMHNHSCRFEIGFWRSHGRNWDYYLPHRDVHVIHRRHGLYICYGGLYCLIRRFLCANALFSWDFFEPIGVLCLCCGIGGQLCWYICVDQFSPMSCGVLLVNFLIFHVPSRCCW